MQMHAGAASRRPLPGAILVVCYLYTLLHWISGTVMFGLKLGFTPRSVARYYLGDPELFMNPRSFSGLLEVTHFHLFAMALFYLVFCHLLAFTPLRSHHKRWLTCSLAATLSGDLVAGWLIRYAWSGFAWLKLATFVLLQGTILLLLVVLVRSHFDQRPGTAKTNGETV